MKEKAYPPTACPRCGRELDIARDDGRIIYLRHKYDGAPKDCPLRIISWERQEWTESDDMLNRAQLEEELVHAYRVRDKQGKPNMITLYNGYIIGLKVALGERRGMPTEKDTKGRV